MVNEMKKTEKTENTKENTKQRKRWLRPFAKYGLYVATPILLGLGVYKFLESTDHGSIKDTRPKPVLMSVTKKSKKKAEKKEVKKKAGVKCFANRAPVSCGLKKPLVRGIVTNTKPLKMGNLLLRLEEVMNGGTGGNHVELTVLDSCGKVLNNNKYSTIGPKVIFVEGAEYIISVNKVHIPSENGTKWADVTVWLSCFPSDCEKSSQILDTAENNYPIQVGNVIVSFMGVKYDGKARRAVLLVEDTGRKPSRKRTVEVTEGESKAVAKDLYVRVPAAGYDCIFGNSWAKVEVYDSPLQ